MSFQKTCLCLLLTGLLPCMGHAQGPTQAHTVQPQPMPASGAAPTATPLVTPEVAARRALHTHTIRYHKLSHYQAKLETDPAELHATCRFESDIATAPPHKRIALTFDDGPEPGETEFILETLKRHNIHATFFMIGEHAKMHPELVAQVVAQGHHLIGNHSWDHPNFHSINAAQQGSEVEMAQDALTDMTGRLFRYPYGNSSCDTNSLLHDKGYKIVGWHVDSCDWAFDRNETVDAKEAAACGVLPQFRSDYVGHVLSAIKARNGGIVLMHEIHPSTLRKLDAIIVAALADGFTFGAIDEPEFAPSMR